MFTVTGKQMQLGMQVNDRRYSFAVGLDGVYRTSELHSQRWACRGRWVNGNTFMLEQEAPGKVLRRGVTMTFKGDTLSFEVHDRITDSVHIYNAKMVGEPTGTKLHSN